MSTYTKRSSTRRSDDTMDDDGDDKDDTKRKSRNLSEKKRRDQFNMLVNELSSMVSSGARKMDKSTVLRSTISFLKNHNEITIRSRAHEIQEDWKPAFLSNEEFTHLILEALDGFIVVFSAAGHVHYVSESVTALLGHLPSELLNTSVYELVWDEEQAALYQALVGSATGNNGTGPDGQLSFQAHLRRGGGDAHQPENPTDNSNDCYELVNFVGYLRTDVDMLETSGQTESECNRFSGYSGEADTRLFVGTGRLQTPQLIREMSLVDAADMAAAAAVAGSGSGGVNSGRGNSGEFTSRHSLEWKFLFLDHRAPPIIGYLPFEVLGTSGYDYYHVDDLDKVVNCHEALMQKGEGTSCYYRFLTKGQQWIWLQTRFYITYHQWNSKPEFIVCTHRVVSYVDVMKQSRKECGGDGIIEISNNSSNSEMAVVDSSPVPTSTPRSGTSSPWGAASSSHRDSAASTKGGGRHHQHNHHHHHHHRRATTRTPSDCTSMSADSPASRHHNGGRTSRMSSHSHNQMQPQQVISATTVNQGSVMFVEPVLHQLQPQNQEQYQAPTQQNVAAIPVQSAVITGLSATPATAVLLPLPQPVVDNTSTMVMSATTGASPMDPNSTTPTATHLQAQLQRKHAELQAIIGQQQAELRRVSEQLLMARLGLLATPAPTGVQHQQIPQHSQQQMMHQQHQSHNMQHHGQQQHTMFPQHQTSTPYICNSNVSSTTTQSPCLGNPDGSAVPGVPISIAVPVVSVATHGSDHMLAVAPPQHRRQSNESATMALSQQQAQMLFSSSGNNNQ